jgi:hypothetical protein
MSVQKETPHQDYKTGPIGIVRFQAAKPKEGIKVSEPVSYADMPFEKIKSLLTGRPMIRRAAQ